MIFLSVCTNDTCLFDHSGDIIYVIILTSVRVEPTNGIGVMPRWCNGVAEIGAKAAFVGSTLTDVKIII